MPLSDYNNLEVSDDFPPIIAKPDQSVQEVDIISHSVMSDNHPLADSSPTESNPVTKTDIRELAARIKPLELRTTTRQLATLLQAGLPLVPALAALSEQLDKSPLASVMQNIYERVSAGSSLANALQIYESVFSPLYINMVRAGEASGALSEVLMQLAQLLEKRQRLMGKVKSALAYPILMTVVAAGVVVFLMAFVIPNIAEIFIDMNRTLPTPTVILISTSMFIKVNFIAISVIIGVCTALVCTYIKSKKGKYNWDRAKLKLPIFGDLILKVEITRLTRILGVMLKSGISILDALDIARGVLQNSYITSHFKQISDDITKGNPIAESLKTTGLFPPIIHHTIAIGEMSGNLDEQLMNIADIYDEEIDTLTRALTTLIEPIILIIMGLVVGFIVLALLLPIFEINQMF